MRTIEKAPDRFVVGGVPRYGLFDAPVRDPNVLDAAFAPGPLRRVRLKDWQHWAIVHPDVYVSIAVVDAAFMTASWVFVFDRRTGKSIEHARKLPLSRVHKVGTIRDGLFGLDAGGYRIQVVCGVDRGEHRIAFDLVATKTLPRVRGEVAVAEDLAVVQPLVSAMPFSPNRPFYSHKCPGPASGWLEVGGERHEYDAARDVGILDEHKAFYPRKTWWKWATFAGIDAAGTLFGANLTQNLIPDAVGNENAVWLGNSLNPLGAAQFDIPAGDGDPWRIRTIDGLVDLEFRPQGMRQERMALGIAESFYRQPVGTYHGFLTATEGRRIDVDGTFGVAEDHRVTW